MSTRYLMESCRSLHRLSVAATACVAIWTANAWAEPARSRRTISRIPAHANRTASDAGRPWIQAEEARQRSRLSTVAFDPIVEKLRAVLKDKCEIVWFPDHPGEELDGYRAIIHIGCKKDVEFFPSGEPDLRPRSKVALEKAMGLLDQQVSDPAAPGNPGSPAGSFAAHVEVVLITAGVDRQGISKERTIRNIVECGAEIDKEEAYRADAEAGARRGRGGSARRGQRRERAPWEYSLNYLLAACRAAGIKALVEKKLTSLEGKVAALGLGETWYDAHGAPSRNTAESGKWDEARRFDIFVVLLHFPVELRATPCRVAPERGTQRDGLACLEEAKATTVGTWPNVGPSRAGLPQPLPSMPCWKGLGDVKKDDSRFRGLLEHALHALKIDVHNKPELVQKCWRPPAEPLARGER